ncbi:MAG: tannase/feruloyl esterase family alpha/beta hydrolase [Acidobacteriaceae bacterium]
MAAMGQQVTPDGGGTAAARCEALTAVALDGAKVTSAVLEPAGTVLPDVTLQAAQTGKLPAFCRVRVTGTPSDDSDIKTEVWLPAAGWNGRYRAQGNGGFAGNIYFEALAAAVMQGYATSGTDTGHASDGGTFALGHPEKVKDFGWRAVHDMTVQTKVLVKAFYGKDAEHAYFMSCSDGGREALMEAQRFPGDFDGILAGAPAYNWTELVSAGTADDQRLMSSAAAYLPASKLPAITAAVLAACDANDGLKDGVVSDPATCGFDPAVLACKGAESDACLTTEQVTTLKSIYAAKVDAQGKEMFPGYEPGSESARLSWGRWIVGKAQGDPTLMMYFGLGYFRNFVYGREDWSLATFDFDRDSKVALAKTGQELNATDTNLKPFVERGGKLLMYHGWNDPAIPALSTVEYYDGVVASMGRRATESAVRLYMVPGMLHCEGGPGATDFGQDEAEARGDAQHDVFTALEQWVEKGKAPGTMTATKFVDDDKTKGVVMTRPVCVYPATERYVKGDGKDAASFACVDASR